MNTLMFADDIVLLPTSAEGLRRHLFSLESVSKELKMEVNTAKTKISVIGRNTNIEPGKELHYIERVEAYKYLGVWITTDGNYGRAKQHLANQGKKAVYSLKTTIRKLQYPPVLITLKLFDIMVLPILSYGAEIWGFLEDSSLEAVELHYLTFHSQQAISL